MPMPIAVPRSHNRCQFDGTEIGVKWVQNPSAGVDKGFSTRRGADPPGDAPTYDFVNFPKKGA